MRVLGIIPARGGSKRVPRKNLRPLGGRPLVAWAIDACVASAKLARFVVSSDDAEVLRLAGPHGLERPGALSEDRSPAIDYVRHALEVLAEPFDATCIVQPSSPFTTGADIDATIALLEGSDADSAVSVMKLDHATHPVKLKRLVGDRLLPFLEEEAGRMADYELPELYVRNCSVYVSRRRIVDAGELIGADSRGHVMPRERSIDINDELDLAFAEFMLARRIG